VYCGRHERLRVETDRPGQRGKNCVKVVESAVGFHSQSTAGNTSRDAAEKTSVTTSQAPSTPVFDVRDLLSRLSGDGTSHSQLSRGS